MSGQTWAPPRHPVWFAVGLAIAAIWQLGMYVGNGFVVGTIWLLITAIPIWLIVARRRRARRHAGLIARADFEHHALLTGDTVIGTYGAFQPKDPT
jgi:hypothetical protein